MWSPGCGWRGPCGSGVGLWTDSIGCGSPCWLPVPLPASPSGEREMVPKDAFLCGGRGLVLLPPAGYARPRPTPRAGRAWTGSVHCAPSPFPEAGGPARALVPPSVTVREGYLLKRKEEPAGLATRFAFKKRYFWLSGETLSYSKSPEWQVGLHPAVEGFAVVVASLHPGGN